MVGLRFENVCLQADVELLRAGLIVPGKVKWKGGLPGKYGNWVGIELRTRIGIGNGCYKGVQYFSCADGYGVFVKSSQLRFPQTKGRSCSSYRRISNESSVDEMLFGCSRKVNGDADPKKLSCISDLYAVNARSYFPEKYSISSRRNYHLGHPIGSRFASSLYNSSGPLFNEQNLTQKHFAAKMEEKHFRKLSTGLLVSTYSRDSANDPSRLFISSPSIPCIKRYSSNAWV